MEEVLIGGQSRQWTFVLEDKKEKEEM